MDYITVDSGNREQMPTGSQRDTQDDKPRYDLIGVEGLERVAGLMGRGARKYGENNWRLGQPASRYFASMMRHAYQWAMGDDTEDHLAAVVFNAFGIMHIEKHAKFKALLDHERYTLSTHSFNMERLNLVHAVVADYQVAVDKVGGTTDALYEHFVAGKTDVEMSRDMFADTLMELERNNRIALQQDGIHTPLWQAANVGTPEAWDTYETRRIKANREYTGNAAMKCGECGYYECICDSPDYDGPHATYCRCEKCIDEECTDD